MPIRIVPPTAMALALSAVCLSGAAEPDTVSIAGQDTSSEGGFASYAGPLRAVHPAFRLIDLTPPGAGVQREAGRLDTAASAWGARSKIRTPR